MITIHDLFRSLLALTPSLLLTTTGCETPIEGPEATFEGLWQEFDAHYGNFDLRGIDWDDSYQRYRPMVDDAMSDDELFAVLSAMMAETDDGHVHMTAPGRQLWSANQIRRDFVEFELFDADLTRSYLAEPFVHDANMGYTLGQLESGYAYVQLEWISDQLPILADARAMAEDSGGLVLDLRHNGGGDFTWALDVLAEWSSTTRPAFRTRTRNGPGRDEFTPWFTWSVEGRGTDIDFPVVVLIDRYTISAGERMIFALSTFDEVVFIGQPTNGALATTIGRELLNGWYVTIPTQEVLAPNDDISYEGVGFPPDELLVNDPQMMALGVDEVLERAVEILDGG